MLKLEIKLYKPLYIFKFFYNFHKTALMKALTIPNTYQVGSKATKDLYWAENGVGLFQKLTALVRINRLK